MDYDDYIDTQDIIELMQIIDAWEIPEEDYARVVNDQVQIMAGLGHLEPSADLLPDIPFASLRF